MASMGAITVPVRLDARTFGRFSRFDAFALRRRWQRPLVFLAIFTAFAVVAFASGRPQSGLIGGVLLAVGLGLPLVWFGSYFAQLRAEARLLQLDAPRHVYTVTLDFDGIRAESAHSGEPPLVLRWEKAHAAYRVKGCVYLYVTPARAYLLPDGQADVGDDALWACLCQHMGDRCHDRR